MPESYQAKFHRVTIFAVASKQLTPLTVYFTSYHRDAKLRYLLNTSDIHTNDIPSKHNRPKL